MTLRCDASLTAMLLPQVMEDNEVESLKARVQLIIDEEALMSQWDLDNPQQFPQSIQVLQSHRKPEPPWAGLGGKMANEIKDVQHKVTGVEEKMDKMEGNIHDKVTGVEDKMDKMEGNIHDKVGNIQDKVTGVEEKVTGVEEKTAQMQAKVQELSSDVSEMRETQATIQDQLSLLLQHFSISSQKAEPRGSETHASDAQADEGGEQEWQQDEGQREVPVIERAEPAPEAMPTTEEPAAETQRLVEEV